MTDHSKAEFGGEGSLLTLSLWRAACVILSCYSLLFFLFYWPTFRNLISQWQTGAFSHAYLVFPVSAYLAWLQRDHLKLLKPAPTLWVIPFLFLFALGWLLGELTSTDVLQQLCVIAMVVASIWGVLGTAVARELWLPLTFLFFAVPMGVSLIPKLQDTTAWSAVRLLDLSGVPVLLEGRYISVPSGRWEVAEACSGLRYLTSSVAIGYLGAGLVYRSWIRRIAFLLASVVLPIVANGLRVYGIVLIAHLSGNRIAAGLDHLLYGWIFFMIVTFLLLWIGFKCREDPQREADSLSVAAGGSPDLSNQRPAEENPRNIARWTAAKRSVLYSLFFFLVIALAPFSLKVFWSHASELSRHPITPPPASLPWRTTADDKYEWKPNYLKPTTELIQSYESQEQAVKLYLAYYAADQRDVRLASSMDSLFDKAIWQRTGEGKTAVTLDGQAFYVHETFIRSPQSSLVVWNLYWVNGQFTDNDYFAKVLLARSRFLRSRQGAAAIVLATEDSESTGRATDTLKEFLNHIALQNSLRSAGN